MGADTHRAAMGSALDRQRGRSVPKAASFEAEIEGFKCLRDFLQRFSLSLTF